LAVALLSTFLFAAQPNKTNNAIASGNFISWNIENAGNYPHIFNPDAECREDDYIPQEPPKQPDKPQENPNRTCNYNGKQYVIRNGNVFALDGKSVSNEIRNAVLRQCGVN
jgi:hypothetical protein